MMPWKCKLWKKKNLVREDLASAHFTKIKNIVDSSHFSRSLLRCNECDQLYLYEFYEQVDFNRGEDKIHTTYFPVDENEADEFIKMSPLELLAKTPRINYDHDGMLRWVCSERS